MFPSKSSTEHLLWPELLPRSFPLMTIISVSVGRGRTSVVCDGFPQMMRCTPGNLKKGGRGIKAYPESHHRAENTTSNQAPGL